MQWPTGGIKFVTISSLDEKAELLDSYVALAGPVPMGPKSEKKCGSQFGLRGGDLLSPGGDIGIDMHRVESMEVPFTCLLYTS